MDRVGNHETMTDACLRAGEAVMQHGSPELQAAMRVVLFVLGQEIARRTVQPPLPDPAARKP